MMRPQTRTPTQWISKVAVLSACFTVLGLSSALADDDCFVPMANWQPPETVRSLASGQGWVVTRIKIDDGCYEIKGSDADGREIEVTLHPETLDVLEIEYEDEEFGD